jgi:hypothetical protein
MTEAAADRLYTQTLNSAEAGKAGSPEVRREKAGSSKINSQEHPGE